MKIICNKFDFTDILDIVAYKAVNEHARFLFKGHITEDTDEYVLRSSTGQDVEFTVTDQGGAYKLFNGLISDISIRNENDMRTLTVCAISRSMLMDIEPETRTFQDSDMTYQTVTSRMKDKHGIFNFIWPSHGDKAIDSMTVQYEETDWQYAKRLAGRLGTVVVPDYLLEEPYVSVGILKRPVKQGVEAISYSIKKDLCASPDGLSERCVISYTVKSREVFDLCDPIPFLEKLLYVYAIDTRYEGSELVHYYTLKEENGFHTKPVFNKDLIGASLRGNVKEVWQDKVRVDIADDVKQTQHKWFPYATPFSQPNGYGWYFMPEIGDEIRLQFPSENEHDAYVSSAVHVAHDNRTDPNVKYIRTIYGQVIQFDPGRILIRDGAGSNIALHNGGISMTTDKTINIDAQSDIVLSASGKVEIAGQEGVVMQKGSSVINIDDAIDISSEHTRVQ